MSLSPEVAAMEQILVKAVEEEHGEENMCLIPVEAPHRDNVPLIRLRFHCLTQFQ